MLGVVRVLMVIDWADLGVVQIAREVVRLIQGVVSGVGELSSYLGGCAHCSGKKNSWQPGRDYSQPGRDSSPPERISSQPGRDSGGGTQDANGAC